MNKTLKVLSIDFDVFANLPDKTYLYLYPDGIDFNTELSTIIWADRYMKHQNPYQKKIQNITFQESLSNDVLNMIKNNCAPNLPVLITNSHIHIYDWIFQHFDKTKHNSIRITHLDMHHDCFNDNPTLDCGNWIGHVKHDVPNTKIQWVANPISRDMYDLNDSFFDGILTDIHTCKNQTFDLIFLCRSDPWLPPHLDIYFDDFKNQLVKLFDSVLIEESVKKPRPYMSQVDLLNKILEDV